MQEVKNYKPMKDSGIEWIGEIPENWNVISHKYIMHKEKTLCEHYENEDIISLTMSGVIKRDLDNPTGKMPVTFDGYQYVEPEDLLLCLFDIDVTPRCVGIVKNFGLTSPAYSRFKVHGGYFNKYYDYLLRMIDDDKIFVHLAKNLRSSLTESDFGTIKTIVPPLQEQQKIAEFLDEKCGHIDSILEKTKASIEDYKKLKQSVITQAVTKGIRHNRPMKDSSIEWIGEIPKDWEIRKFKYLLSETLQYGANESGVPYDNSLPRYIRITDITQDGKLKENDKLSLPRDVAVPFLLKAGDILFARSGGTVGKSFIYKGEYEESCFAGYLIKATITDAVLPELVYYWTCSSVYEEWKNSIFIQSTIQNIGADKYSNMPIIYISNRQEQQEIVDYLDKKSSEIDKLIEKKEQLISELEIYKKSLIYEYVTGKKEVK